MSFLDEMAAVAAEFAASDMMTDATLARIGADAFDPVTGAVDPQDATSTACRAVASQITTKAADGALVRHTVLTLNVEPQDGDTLTIGSTSYRLCEVTAIAPHGEALIWTATAKG